MKQTTDAPRPDPRPEPPKPYTPDNTTSAWVWVGGVVAALLALSYVCVIFLKLLGVL